MAFGRLERSSAPPPMSDINMTPLIDVMLVLLVIFMITAPLMSSSLKLELPKTEGATASDMPVFIAVAIDPQGRLYIAGEAGHIFRSDDGGETWVTLPSPYDGSFFAVLPLGGESLLAVGLRGHVFRSDDGGTTWAEIESGTTATLTTTVVVIG